jgi:hypothetical protein
MDFSNEKMAVSFALTAQLAASLLYCPVYGNHRALPFSRTKSFVLPNRAVTRFDA